MTDLFGSGLISDWKAFFVFITPGIRRNFSTSVTLCNDIKQVVVDVFRNAAYQRQSSLTGATPTSVKLAE